MVSMLSAWELVPHVGMSMNGNMQGSSHDRLLYTNSPLGLFGVNVEVGQNDSARFSVGIEHTSDIPETGLETIGMNKIVVRQYYKGVYVGGSYTNKALTSSYYLDEKVGTTGVLVGYEKEYMYNMILFVEYEATSKKDLLMYGFKLKFKTK